ncbi:PaaI family thioesterase [Skermania piniformis]|uniref:PaaI family thioesterase n=1 Tax=Skermania pinensis TaxID=39122 RepID=A0ABX8S971_9ACTN|nr:PaaI family thioesterase [Skermania piniformis]QXQ14410.1 PaaI family thioesterase [Skermania piniformis]
MTQTTLDTRGHGDFVTESRTVTWAVPGQGDLAELATLDGLGQLLAMGDGRLPHPPIMDTVGITDLRAERGRVVVEMPSAAFHYNPLGGVHGGVIATLLDTACGCAVHSTLAVGEGYTSLDLTVKFLRPVTVDSGLLTCVGTIIQRGRRTALARADLTDEYGKLVAHATSSCMIFAG